YDRKDYRTAVITFGQLLPLFDDADLAGAVGKPPLSDLRMLADGFHQLSLQALAPPPAPAPAPLPVVAAAKPVPPAPEPPKIYSTADANVVPPVVVRQDLPPFSGIVERPLVGAME